MPPPLPTEQDPAIQAMLAMADQIQVPPNPQISPPPPPPLAAPFTAASPEAVGQAPESLGNPKVDDRLSPTELQELREIIMEGAARKKNAAYELPKIVVTEDDKERFYTSIAERKPYAEKMVIIPEKLEVVFRCKTRLETERVDNQLLCDLSDQYAGSERGYATSRINYDLMTQIVSVNDIEADHPSAHHSEKNFSLRGFVQKHLINDLPEPMMFMLSGALTQFNYRCDEIAKDCLKTNFPQPVAL